MVQVSNSCETTVKQEQIICFHWNSSRCLLTIIRPGFKIPFQAGWGGGNQTPPLKLNFEVSDPNSFNTVNNIYIETANPRGKVTSYLC